MKILKIAVGFLIVSFLILHIVISNTPRNCSMMRNEANLRTLETALKLFYLDTNRFPTNDEGLDLLVSLEEGVSIEGYKPGGYISELPYDDSGSAYQYISYQQRSGAQAVVVWTFGADELPGGEERSKDIYRYLVLDEILKP